MNTVCPKCAYRRGPDEVVPDYECPRCGVIYEKYVAAMARREKEAVPAPAEAIEMGGHTPSAGNGSERTQAPSSGSGGGAVPSTSADLPDAPAPEDSTPWLRYMGLAAAFLLLVGVIAISARERRGGAASGPRPIAGVYEGSTTREIPLTDGRPYQAEYAASFTVGEDGRVSQITWTDSNYLLDRATVSWTTPGQVEYTLVLRDDYTRAFEDPPRGAYDRFSRDGGSYRIEAAHPNGADLRRFEYTGEIPLTVAAKELVTTGVFGPSRADPGGSEAVIRPGLPKMGQVEADSGEVLCEFAESAASRALQPYLHGGKLLPGGGVIDLDKPIDGVDIERVMVPRWPGRLWVAFYGVRIRAASDRPAEIELGDGVRIVLDFLDPIGWEARVVFLPDGRAVVRIPARNLEIPVAKVEEVASSED
jgi:hypothetical protein